MLSLINTHLNGFEPLQIKIFMYCLGTPSAIAMAPVLEEKKQKNLDDDITAWRFYKPAKKNSRKISRLRHTFMSYVVKCELEVAKLTDSEMINAKENFKYAEQMLFDKIYLMLNEIQE
jgi:hypothetical protein